MLSLTALVVNVLYLFAVISPVFSSGDGNTTNDDGNATDILYFLDETGVTREINISMPPDSLNSYHYGIVNFYLFTRNNPLFPEQLYVPTNDSKLESKYFNASNDIKAITHGWISSGSSRWVVTMKDNYLEKFDLNVIIVDWSRLAMNPVYPYSAAATRYVGKRISKLLVSLMDTYEVGGEDMHLIGHSLGAHVMGFAGMFLNDTVNRISGLDPARPLFEIPPVGDDCRLSRYDAGFVDIIHTCAGVYGYLDSHGTADYYANGGKPPQPGCENPEQPLAEVSCSHGKAHEYFNESIKGGTPFTSYPCESYEEFENGHCRDNTTLMGNPASEKSYGNYYLHTRSEYPYAVGDEFNSSDEEE